MMPEVPDADLTLEEFLARPAWQTRALRRGCGAAQWVKGRAQAPVVVDRNQRHSDRCHLRPEPRLFALVSGATFLGRVTR